MHITISFSKEDERRLNLYGSHNRQLKMQEIVEDCIKHHTMGYDINNEVIAYSEAHIPKMKEDDEGKERFTHVHGGVLLYNPLSDTKLRPNFAKTTFIDDVFQSYINQKYNLTQPRHTPRDKDREKEYISKVGKKRKDYIEELKEIGSMKELEAYLKRKNIDYRVVETSKNHYVKILTGPKEKDINLQGRGFEHLSIKKLQENDAEPYEANEDKDIEALKEILDSYYAKRIEDVESRRSKATKDKLAQIHNSTTNDDIFFDKKPNRDAVAQVEETHQAPTRKIKMKR